MLSTTAAGCAPVHVFSLSESVCICLGGEGQGLHATLELLGRNQVYGNYHGRWDVDMIPHMRQLKLGKEMRGEVWGCS